VKSIHTGGHVVNETEAHAEESVADMMIEIVWHCRETRQRTENTNVDLRYPHGEIPEGRSGSERLACRQRSVRNLRGLMGSWKATRYTVIETPKGKPGNGIRPEPEGAFLQVSLAN
jgi:hypothetical protein